MGTPLRNVVIDQETRTLIRGSLVIEPDGAIEIRLPYRLESPNKLLHAHWRVRTREKQDWRTRLLMVLGDAAHRPSLGEYLVKGGKKPIEALGLPPVRDKRRVRVSRLVPSSRNFIRDDDNLAYCVKPLMDQIRAFGFLRDDSRVWTEMVPVTQAVSEDKRDWTVIRIEVPSGVSTPWSF